MSNDHTHARYLATGIILSKGQIEDLEERVEILNEPLSKAAQAYYESRKGKLSHAERKCCGRGWWVFSEIKENLPVGTGSDKVPTLPLSYDAHMLFFTECSWCSYGEGGTLLVPISYVEEYLQD
jgi:hypothetical protein